MDRDQKLVVLVDSLGEGADVDFARQVLEAHDWNLEAALDTVTDSRGGHGSVASLASPDGYRAPMRTGYTDRLVGPEVDPFALFPVAANGDHAAHSAVVAYPGGASLSRRWETGGHSANSVRHALRMSALEYQRYADHQEQASIARALETSCAQYAADEEKQVVSVASAAREEQELMARAIEASLKEQTLYDVEFRQHLERATQESLVDPDCATMNFLTERAITASLAGTDGTRSSQKISPKAAGSAGARSSRPTETKKSGPNIASSRHQTIMSKTAHTLTTPIGGARRGVIPGCSDLPRSPPSASERCSIGVTSDAQRSGPLPVDFGPTEKRLSATTVPGAPIASAIRNPPARAGTASASSGSGSQPARGPLQPKPPVQRSAATPPTLQASLGRCSPLASQLKIARRGDEPSDAAVGVAARRPNVLKPLVDSSTAPGQDDAEQAALEADRRRREAEEVEWRRLEMEKQATQRRAECEGMEAQQQRREAENPQRKRLAVEQQAAVRQRAPEASTFKSKERARDCTVALGAEKNCRHLKDEELQHLHGVANADVVSRQQTESNARDDAAAGDHAQQHVGSEGLQRDCEALSPGQTSEQPTQPQSGEKETNDVARTLMALRKRYADANPVGLITCLQTLRAYIGNLAKNPYEQKFQRIRSDNQAFQTRVVALEGGVAVLEACGFTQTEDAWVVDPVFLKTKGPRLWDALSKLDVVLDQVKGREHLPS